MPPLNLYTALQIIIGLGLLNVWLLRANSATAFRGGASKSLKQEFAAYGLPQWCFYTVGALKIGSAIALLVGLWVPVLVAPAAWTVVGLMVGALIMHLKVGDEPIKSVPAFLMLGMSLTLAASGLI